jgi:hypothetical protein
MIDQTSAVPSAASRTRYTSEAVRTGDAIPAGDAGLKLNELYPHSAIPTRRSPSRYRVRR